jgi:Methyltransferase domain
VKINSDWQKRNCPTCDLETQASECPLISSKVRAEFLSFTEVSDLFVGLRKNQTFFSYYRCGKCGLLYCPWYFSSDQLRKLYAEMPDNTMGEDKSTVSRTQSAYAKFAIKQCESPSGLRYLEIGPDLGLVTREIAKRQDLIHASLVEPNKSVHSELRENSGKVGSLEVVEYVDDLKQREFDLTVGVHVYDHLLSPVSDLIQLSALAVESGKLVIVVHNEKSLLRFALKSKWPPFCLQHPQLYNKTTISALLAKSGWQVINISRTSNWYHFKHLLRLAFSILGLGSIFRFIPNLNFEFPVKLGNIIVVAERI